MTSSILNFFDARSRTPTVEAPRGWTNQELAEFYRVADSLSQAGLAVDTDFGLSDEGEPWFAFYHPETADVVAHFARIDGRFVAAGAALHEVVDGRDLREIIDRLLRTRPLLMPVGKGHGASNLLLHPAIVLTAFVATALFSMQDAEAAPLGDGSHGHAAAAPAEKPAKAAPTLIQKLLAGANHHGGGDKHSTAEALSQGLQQAALQSAIAFAVAQIPAGTAAMQAGDLLDTQSFLAAQATTHLETSSISIQSLAEFVGTGQKLHVAAPTLETAAVAAAASHAASDINTVTIAPTAAVSALLLPAFEQVLVAHNDALSENAVKATATLLDLLREVAQTSPQHMLQAQAPQDSATTTKSDVAPVAKTFEVTLTVDAQHTTFLQSTLFKELMHAQTLEVTTDATKAGSDGTVTVKLTFESKQEPTTSTPDVAAPVSTPTPADGASPAAVPQAAAPAPAPAPAPVPDTIVKTGIDVYDRIIDFTFHATASNTDALTQALRDIDQASGHLLAGAKRIVLFDSHDLSLDVYRISDDVVMVDREALHLGHDQAAAGHSTLEMHLPNGGSVELLGVLAPSPGLF